MGGNPNGKPKPPKITKALTPSNQQTPWEPTIYTDSTDDEKNAAYQYTQVYGGKANYVNTPAPTTQDTGLLDHYSIPDLSMAYTKSPDLIPTAPDSQGSYSGPDLGAIAQLDPVFNIDCQMLLSTEQTFLDTTNDLVSAYEQLKSTVLAATTSDSIFGQNVGYQQSYVATTTDDGWPQTYGTEVVYEDLNKGGIAFANSINPAMELLMKSIGDWHESLGQYNAMINNAGQMYAYTDSICAFPPTDAIVADVAIAEIIGAFQTKEDAVARAATAINGGTTTGRSGS